MIDGVFQKAPRESLFFRSFQCLGRANMTEQEVQHFFLGRLAEKKIGILRKIIDATFPIRYPDSFYDSIVENADTCRIGYYRDVPIGAICCRFEDGPLPGAEAECGRRLYIPVLAVLAPYRRMGFASVMLKWALAVARKPHLSVQGTPSGGVP
eukprot:Polyplicarium_translucidae@DN2440_c0_g1_i1.p9